jgi:hypothetical protein
MMIVMAEMEKSNAADGRGDPEEIGSAYWDW